MSALDDHLATGTTHLCRCWAVTRRDGQVFGFTDHDGALSFDGITFRADAGLSAKALMQGTGLSVDNSEAVGALSDAAITEVDIDAGQFDGAEVRAWIVCWDDVAVRRLRFRGHLGEIRRGAGAFHAELRGLTERLNQPQGRVYQSGCDAVLGDGACRFDLTREGYVQEAVVEAVEDDRVFVVGDGAGQADRWFERGRLVVVGGAGEGLVGVIKTDRAEGAVRRIGLWEPLRARIAVGDRIRIEAGCDKRFETCRAKFGNAVNFQGFPHIPGEDWLVRVPRGQGADTGGSLLEWLP